MPHEPGAPTHQPNTPPPSAWSYAYDGSGRMTGITDFEHNLVAEVRR